MHPFRSAVETDDHGAITALLADDVKFLSPVAFAPHHGRELVAGILRGAGRAFERFRYTREIANADARDHALMLEARIGEREVQGCDLLHHDDEGLITELRVMVRPPSAGTKEDDQ